MAAAAGSVPGPGSPHPLPSSLPLAQAGGGAAGVEAVCDGIVAAVERLFPDLGWEACSALFDGVSEALAWPAPRQRPLSGILLPCLQRAVVATEGGGGDGEGARRRARAALKTWLGVDLMMG